MALAQLKLLVNLARIDGDVAERERKYISTIGQANSVPVNEVNALFEQEHDVIIPDDLTGEQKFNYIFSLVQLMKIDERLYKDEIQYCSKVASRLGYEEPVLFELMLHVRGAMEAGEKQVLKRLTEQFLSK